MLEMNCRFYFQGSRSVADVSTYWPIVRIAPDNNAVKIFIIILSDIIAQNKQYGIYRGH
jgi:hypothetical protein